MSVPTKVLLVDDDVDLLEMVCMALEAQKFIVACIEDGEQVLPGIHSIMPNLILMDIYLGNVDGREICRQIKTIPGLKEIPVILYSAGNIQPETIHASKADMFIKKPFELSYLYKTIDSLVKGRVSDSA